MRFSRPFFANLKHVLIPAKLALFLIVTAATYVCCGQEPQIGSTATLQQIQKGWQSEPAVSSVPSIPRETALVTEPATAPVPKLQYRFWPNDLSLRPGTALVHLDRALLFYQSVGQPELRNWGEYQIALGDANPDPKDLATRLALFENVYKELDRFAECEDQSCDLRLRDLQGLDVYGFLLPEFQQYRELARLLRFRALEQLGRRDFTGAIASIRCGYRLAAYVRQGETVIQQLVGVAIETIMQSTVEEAIRTPGCPNLYFALATVPHERGPMLRALEFEFTSFERALPILKNPEAQTWAPDTWKQEWIKTAEDLDKVIPLSGKDSGPGFRVGLNLLLAAEVASDARDARKRLVESGLSADSVAAMCPEQVIAVDAARQLRMHGDELLAAALQPHPIATGKIAATEKRLSLQVSRTLGALMGNLLSPAVEACFRAETRIVSTHHRLLTVEAVRHFVATHGGQLPKSLAELTDLAPHIDLHTGELIGYEVKSGPDGEYAEFSIQAPTLPEELRVLKLRLRK